MSWECESFYEKSRLYIRQADNLASEDRFYVFWHLLAFEHLVKACLSKKSKSLLADPSGPLNILYSIGVEVTATPKQRSIKELLEMLKSVVKDFTKEDCIKSIIWINQRNEELHSGADQLTSIAVTGWIGDFYIVTEKLLIFLDNDLVDYYGVEKAPFIERVIKEMHGNVRGVVEKEISLARAFYSKLSVKEIQTITTTFKRPAKSKIVKCPACSEDLGVIFGEKIHTTEIQFDGENLFTISKYLPSTFECGACRLKLNGYSHISAAGISAEYSIKEFIDPIEQFHIEDDEVSHSRHPEDDDYGYDEYMDE